MKPTDFSMHLTNFLTHHLAAQRNLSPNTIRAYRDVFTLLLRYCRDRRGLALERIALAQIDVAMVEAFLDHLRQDRQASIRTQNHRLAVLHSFFRYVQAESPEHLLQCQRILAIPMQRHEQPCVGYLSKEDLTKILAQPDLHAHAGRRDAVLLSVLYDTGARVQELIDLSVGDLRLSSPAQVRLLGKGRKMRAVPLMDSTVRLLQDHLRENDLEGHEHSEDPLFCNRRRERLTRSGVRYILQRYVEAYRNGQPGFTQTVSPHSMRHTKGMHLLQSGVPLDIIRDFLGHTDVKTTQIYARANLEMKRAALEKAVGGASLPKMPSWTRSKSLLEWLSTL